MVSPEPEGFADGPVCLTLWLEKTPGVGEDAPPLLELLGEDRSEMLVGAFDGLGGAGAMAVTLSNGESQSNAYLASRLARQVCRDYFIGRSFRVDDDMVTLVKELKTQLEDALRAGIEGAVQQGSKLRGTLVHQLPTTLALAYARANGAATVQTLITWAGDSRIYCLGAGGGLVQLTVDDLQTTGDAFANLTNDSPMSNFASASRAFRLNYRVGEVAIPCILLAATDGCFDYLPTPMHWEYLLLYTLVRANTSADWGRELEQRLGEVAGDDVSLALVGLGFNSFGELKLALADRFAAMKRDYMMPLHAAPAEITGRVDGAHSQKSSLASDGLQEARRQERALRHALWTKYKPGYEWDGPPIEQEA